MVLDRGRGARTGGGDPPHPALFCSVMGLAYGIIDVIEDCKLAELLEKPTRIESRTAAGVKRLTQAKIATLTLSGIGTPVFMMFGAVHFAIKLLKFEPAGPKSV